MRADIIASISDQSDAYKEEIDRLSAEISSAQDELQALMSEDSISLESIVAFKQDIFSASDAEQKIRNIDNRLNTLNTQLQAAANTSEAKKEQQTAVLNLIISKMNEASVVWEIKKDYPHIQSILVLLYLDKKVDTSHYDNTVYPPLESVPRRYAIPRRNCWMVDVSDVIIADVNHGWGGAAQTLQYAMSKKKTIINFFAWDRR